MQTKGQEAAARFKAFAHETLAAMVCPEREPLNAEVFQTPDRITVEEALRGSYRPVQVGWRWGPRWSSAWFRIRGAVPAGMAGKRVCTRFSSGTEALMWRDGVPHHGFDVNRDTVLLFPSARGREPVDLLIEAACNHVLGTTHELFWEPKEWQERWTEAEPGRFERCELVTVDEEAWRLMRTFEFARLLVEQLQDDSPALGKLVDAMARVAEGVPRNESFEILSRAMDRGKHPSKTVAYAVGHAHLDTAWLWPIAETKRKALRTFANSLRLMERFPEYRFLCSQPQQYAWVKERSPELYGQIRSRVKEGRWEAAGAMWIEPDGNLPSGESFVRQLIHGIGFFEKEFGEGAPQRLAYLPDTFGFAASLPQIFRLAGLDTFITNKLWWNQTNEFPFMHFRWRGIDGTEIVSHLTPGQEYNATNTPFELMRGQRNAERKAGVGVWLQPFGFGDGGGGPTDWHILYANLAAHCEGLAHTNLRGAAAFCDDLHARVREVEGRGESLPVWDGELYLERHRGTYTTEAAVKKGNAEAEASLRVAEWLVCGGPRAVSGFENGSGSLPPAPSLREGELGRAWKLTLLNQFHDILPGSSIGEVYADARRDLAEVKAVCDRVEASAVAEWLKDVDTRGMKEPIAVFNPGSTARSSWVEWKDAAGRARGCLVRDVPAMGMRIVDAAKAESIEPARVTVKGELSNGIVSARIDRLGRVVSLHAGNGRELAAAPMNQFMLYEDRPATWDAWEIDEGYERTGRAVDADVDDWSIDTTTRPGVAAIRVERHLGRGSMMVQHISLSPRSKRLMFDTWMQWHEDQMLLRVLFPTRLRAERATYEIPFGHVERATTRNTPRDKAMFEVPAHRWMDVSEQGAGLGLLNNCKYGHSCEGGVMGLTLLRAPKWPDPNADRGEHEFSYGLLLHAGDWRAAGVDRAAELMVRPMWAVPVEAGRTGSRGSWAPFAVHLDGGAGVRVAAIKAAESGRGVVVRLVESHGRAGSARVEWAMPVAGVKAIDLLERPMAIAGFAHDGATRFELRPFQIVTLMVEMRGG